MTNPPLCVLVAWESPNWRRLKKAEQLCKNYGLTPLAKRMYIGNIKKGQLSKMFKELKNVFVGIRDRTQLFIVCKSCMTASFIPSHIQEKLMHPPKYEMI